MDNVIKLNISVVSHTGMGFSGNTDNFYINGRYRYDHEDTASMQVSVESSDTEYILAISDGMDKENESSDKRTSISMMKELKKFQEQIKGIGGDLESKAGQLAERIQETGNVIHSMSLVSIPDKQRAFAFAGLFMSDGKASAICTGKNRLYVLRDGNLKNLMDDNKKADKLLKMGIITNEHAKVLSGRFGIPIDDDRDGVHKSAGVTVKEGDIFLICSDGLANIVEEEKIHEILSVNRDTGIIANMFVKEARKKGSKDDITALVARVEQVSGETGDKSRGGTFNRSRSKSKPEFLKLKSLRIAAAVAAACLVVTAALLCFKPLLASLTANGDDTSTYVPSPIPEPTPVDNASGDDVQGGGTGNDNGDTPGTQGDGEREPVLYEVKAGDSLQRISKKFYNDPNKYDIIMKENGLTNPNQLQVGQTLVIPQGAE